VLTAVALLVLMGHAFVVSATHFHRSSPTAAFSQGAQVGLPAEAQRAPLAGGHEQCLLCRLQHNLVAELQHAAPTLDAPRAEAHEPGGRPVSYSEVASHLTPPGRAPPSA
jgi:hypothetical protein